MLLTANPLPASRLAIVIRRGGLELCANRADGHGAGDRFAAELADVGGNGLRKPVANDG